MEDKETKPKQHKHCGEDMVRISKLKNASVGALRAADKLGHKWICNECGYTE